MVRMDMVVDYSLTSMCDRVHKRDLCCGYLNMMRPPTSKGRLNYELMQKQASRPWGLDMHDTKPFPEKKRTESLVLAPLPKTTATSICSSEIQLIILNLGGGDQGSRRRPRNGFVLEKKRMKVSL